MKFKKIPNTTFFSKWIREDGKITIESVDRKINGKWKGIFVVSDSKGNEIETFARLKDAKAVYEN